MGCGCTKSESSNVEVNNKIIFESKLKKRKHMELDNASTIQIPSEMKKCYVFCISQYLWVNILDFLNYKDLRQAGKTSRNFNYIAKSFHILIKFFKNTTYKKDCLYNKSPKKGNIKNHTHLVDFKTGFSNTIEALNGSIPSFQYQRGSDRRSSSNYYSSSSSSFKQSSPSFKKFTTTLGNLKVINTTNSLSDQNENNSNKLILSKFVNQNPGKYIDLFNRQEIDFNKISLNREYFSTTEDTSKNTCSNLDNTPSFHSQNPNYDEFFIQQQKIHAELFQHILRNSPRLIGNNSFGNNVKKVTTQKNKTQFFKNVHLHTIAEDLKCEKNGTIN
jgi:hypothetical protein